MIKGAALSILAFLATASLAEAGVRNFFAPEQDGQRLDSCLTGAGDCGKPAADAFCKAQGYETAIIFQREAAAQTIRPGSGEMCTGADCMSFRQIKCYAAGDTVAAAAN